ncbi:MAG: hypothetical protein NTZ65_01320 [Candidatus Berkelbacteria bacterium]|nr:hypothetical protein [Candidatus Berkelbacteria bacterium]
MKNPEVKKYLRIIGQGFLIWIVVFVITEVVISGGRSERNLYLIILQAIAVTSLSAYLNRKYISATIISTILRGIVLMLSFALLDYLIVNLWLEHNNLTIYRFWPSYINYVLILITPLVQTKMRDFFSVKKIKSS